MDENTRNQIVEVIEMHKKMVAELQRSGIETIAVAVEAIVKSLKQNGRIYICGNGGSAADAQHIAGELVGRFEHERKGLPVVALTTDSSVMTSISNDYGYENVFLKQVEALVRKGDIFWALSTSGTSANIISATRLAKEKGAGVIAFTGSSGSELEQIADICFCVDDKSTARSQEIHQLGYHIICKLVEQNFCE
ncbi:MAG: SIS domain-containing protein [Bacteroidales bacterium]|nr:MAG: SIS domain-containing protein [Bacteroidales bacterium]